jgi:hypothetical protein
VRGRHICEELLHLGTVQIHLVQGHHKWQGVLFDGGHGVDQRVEIDPHHHHGQHKHTDNGSKTAQKLIFEFHKWGYQNANTQKTRVPKFCANSTGFF